MYTTYLETMNKYHRFILPVAIFVVVTLGLFQLYTPETVGHAISQMENVTTSFSLFFFSRLIQ